MARNSNGPASIHVFGAASGIGRWFVSRVFSELRRLAGWDTVAYDISSAGLESLSAQCVDIRWYKVEGEQAANLAYGSQDILILAVQAEVVPHLLNWLAPAYRICPGVSSNVTWPSGPMPGPYNEIASSGAIFPDTQDAAAFATPSKIGASDCSGR